MSEIQRKLAAIFAADVHQFSKMMGTDEAGTLANLQACRQIVDGIIAEHHGRIFGSAGDSVVAEFASAVSAVLCAVECQRAIAGRNEQVDQPLLFRIGVNIGDVIVEGDNLYGDGVNVAARLESVARPGAICVSAKVYDEVRRKLSGISFIDGGARKLKNIEDPVVIYHVGDGTAAEARPAASAATSASDRPLIAVTPVRVISGDDEVRALAEGLTDAIDGALAHNTSIAVRSGDASGADFVLRGTVQAVGKRLRFSFGLDETASAIKVWTERYDRQLQDAFGLQDELVRHVVAAIRIRVKTQLFERLRNADNASLAVPQLLDKAAGSFVRGLDAAGEAVATVRLAVERAPSNSMAWAMLGFGLLRLGEYEATAMPPSTVAEIMASLRRAVVLDPRSYFARCITALALHDLMGDSRGAYDQASEALARNADYVPAQALLGIAEIHLGQVDPGLRRLQAAVATGAEEAGHHYQRRELAVAHLLAGNAAEGARIATRLCEEVPDMKRNVVVLAGLLAAAGDLDSARRWVAVGRKANPGLTLESARLPHFGDQTAGAQFRALLRDAGL
jgi:adenylate cyclase